MALAGVLCVGLYLLLMLNFMRAESTADERVLDAARPAPLARNFLYVELERMGKLDLFPASCRTLEKVAESSMVRWLVHPNELDGVPSKIELIRKVPVRRDQETGTVFFFRFRSQPPHWAAKKGWMVGVAGPYWDGKEPPEVAGRDWPVQPTIQEWGCG